MRVCLRHVPPSRARRAALRALFGSMPTKAANSAAESHWSTAVDCAIMRFYGITCYATTHTPSDTPYMRLFQEKTAFVGQRLRLFIRAQGMSFREFERASGVPYKTLQQYLAGRRYPGGEHLARMAEVGLDINWLLTGRTPGDIWFRFHDAKPMPDILGAFPALNTIFLEKSIQIIDDVHAREAKRLGKPFLIGSLLRSVWDAFSVFGRALDGHSEKVVELAELGWPPEKVAQMFIDPIRAFVLERFKVLQDAPDAPEREGPQ